MNFLFLVIFKILMGLLDGATASSELFNLTLLVTGETRGRLMPVDAKLNECSYEESIDNYGGNCVGGMARKYTYVNNRIASGINYLLLDTGSDFFGTDYYYEFGSTYMANFMGLFNYHAVGISKADFYHKSSALGQYINRFKLTSPSTVFLSNNVDVSSDPFLSLNGISIFLPYKVFRVKDRFVAVISSEDPSIVATTSLGPTVIVNRGGNATTEQMLLSTLTSISKSHPTCNIIIWMAPLYLDISISIVQHVYGIDALIAAPYSFSDLSKTVPPIPSILSYGNTIFSLGGIVNYGGASILDITLSFDSTGGLVSVTGGEIVLTNNSVTPSLGIFLI